MASDKIQKSNAPQVENEVSKPALKSQMRNLLMFLPNFVALCFRLLADNRVPVTEKALFAGAIIYFISPLDFIPDILPFIGQIDDTYLIALSLLRLINNTDETVIRENWRGEGDIVKITNSVASIAPLLLPKRVNKILTSQVEIGSTEKILQAVKNRGASRTKNQNVKNHPQDEN